jgi:hypothetical protein
MVVFTGDELELDEELEHPVGQHFNFIVVDDRNI